MKKVRKHQPLTQKQYEFCNEYIKNGFNAYQAALKAGYSESYANVKAPLLLEHPLIKPRLARAYQRADNSMTVSWEWKIEKLQRIIDDIVPLDKSLPIKHKHAANAIKAISELNKMSGDYAPDKRLSVTVDATKDKLIEINKEYEEF